MGDELLYYKPGILHTIYIFYHKNVGVTVSPHTVPEYLYHEKDFLMLYSNHQHDLNLMSNRSTLAKMYL